MNLRWNGYGVIRFRLRLVSFCFIFWFIHVFKYIFNALNFFMLSLVKLIWNQATLCISSSWVLHSFNITWLWSSVLYFKCLEVWIPIFKIDGIVIWLYTKRCWSFYLKFVEIPFELDYVTSFQIIDLIFIEFKKLMIKPKNKIWVCFQKFWLSLFKIA